MIRRGPRRLPSHGAFSGDRGVLCFWCHAPAPGSPYRSPIEDIPGGRLTVCGPECSERPEGARVFSIGTDWFNQGASA